MPNVIFSGYRAYVRARGRKKNNYYSNPSNMPKEKDSERKARLAKEASERERESRERRLTARGISNSLGDGLAGAAAAAAAAAAIGGSKSGKGARVSSPPRNARDDPGEADSPVTLKGRRSSGGRRVSQAGSSQENSEAEGSGQSVPASESEDEQITTAAKIAATKRLQGKAKIAPSAKEKASQAKERAANDKSASASQVYHHDASVDFTI